MTTGLATAILPTVISSSGFAARRLDKARQANDAAQTTMNSVIASGQIERAAECSANIAKSSSGELANMFMSAEENIKKASSAQGVANNSKSIFKKACGNLIKTLKFIGDYVNEIILITSGIKVLTSKDPVKDGMEEGAGVVGMLAITEPAYKRLMGMSTYERKNGKLITHKHKAAILKVPGMEKAAEAIEDYCKVKNFFGMSMKHVPNIAKGIGLIIASVSGYLGGKNIARWAYKKINGCPFEEPSSNCTYKNMVPAREAA